MSVVLLLITMIWFMMQLFVCICCCMMSSMFCSDLRSLPNSPSREDDHQRPPHRPLALQIRGVLHACRSALCHRNTRFSRTLN